MGSFERFRMGGRAATLWCYLLCCFVNMTTAAAAPSGLAKSFHEENFVCDADDGFVNRCVPKWQEECRNSYAHNPELQTQLCETHLNRNYVKIRTLVGPQDILQQWKWDKARRDYDVGFFRSHFPKFTPTGVSHLKMPADLHSKMKLWLDRNRHSTRPESSQPAFGINCNTGYDNDDWIVSFTPKSAEDRKTFQAVQRWIQKQLAEWTGEDVNELTAIYGARQYHRGSICGMHTDAHETHAFSAIYQLDQQGMDEPWGLDYVTHQGKEERAFMQSGDVALYEGAAVLHGRKDALKGDEFTNVFFHFRSPSWLPAIKETMDGYWPARSKFERAAGVHLTSLADAPKLNRHFKSDDQCLPLRSREDPLMVAGQFMTFPKEETYVPEEASKRRRATTMEVKVPTESSAQARRAADLAQSNRQGSRLRWLACAAGVVLVLMVLMWSSNQSLTAHVMNYTNRWRKKFDVVD